MGFAVGLGFPLGLGFGLAVGDGLAVAIGLVLGRGLGLDAAGTWGCVVTSDTSLVAAAGRLAHGFVALSR
jgi:hypothetical protein